jgi:tRNA A-37 threonylcarbamoyl transferase component Bud32/HAMP domain-containing protein
VTPTDSAGRAQPVEPADRGGERADRGGGSRRDGPDDRSERGLKLSLGTRIFLVTSLLIALSVGASVLVTALLVRNIARKAALDSLQGSAAAQATQQEQYYDQLKVISNLFAGDAGVNAYLAEAAAHQERASILDLLTNRQNDLKFSFAMVLDGAGRVIVRTDNPASRQDLSQQPLVREAITGPKASAGVWREGDHLYYAVAVPVVKADEVLGFMVTAFEITNAAASRVNAASGGDVAFVARDDNGVRVVASTLDPSVQQALAAALGRLLRGRPFSFPSGSEPREVELTLNEEPWLALQSPLRDAAGRPIGATVALASMRKQLATFRRIQEVVLLSGLAAVLIAPFLSLAFTRRTLEPVRRLVAATEAARQGDFNQRIASDSTDEVGKLARAFDELLSDLREKRDMEAYVTELSRNLPEPGPVRVVLGAAQARDSVLMGIELRGYANPHLEAGADQVLERLGVAMQHLETTITSAGGQIEAIAGHRVLARFDSGRRPLGPLAAAAEILQPHSVWSDDSGTEAPSIAIAAGTVVTGPVVWGEQAERGLVGQPVQQIESLLREAAPGDLVLSRDVFQRLRERFVRAGYDLAPRRGLISPQPIYVLTADLAARLAASQAARTPGGSAEEEAEGAEESLVTAAGIAPGTLMGRRFQVLSVLGTGGMGVVYKARDRELDDLVALKVLRRDVAGDRVQLERLKSEIKLARKITHPNVLRTYDFGELDRVAFISMEYVRGVTLRFMLDQAHRLPYSAGLRLAKQLCAGLGAAHAVGVIHRDIKPENLILEPTGNAKLMDFGIARPVSRLTPGQTQAGFIVGTPQYLAPEQVQGGDIDTRADIYSCGVVLYEIFSGEVPFKADTAMEVLVKHLQEEPQSPRVHWPDMPARLEAAILRCLRKSPASRFQTIEELQRELEALSA